MNKIIESIQAVLAKVNFLNLGNTLSPAVYIMAIGAILIIVAFLLALAVKAGSKANKMRKHLDDTVAYINATGTIDAENVEGLNGYLQAKQMPEAVKRGWSTFLEQQERYPSDYIVEGECLGQRKGNPNYKAGKGFYNVVSTIVLAVTVLLAMVGYYHAVKGIDVASVEGVKGMVLLVLPVLATFVVPFVVYVIFGAFLNLALRNQYKKTQQSFRAFQDALDTNVILFREPQDEFISENIEEINAAIEDILASKLGDSEILEIVTTPKVDDSLVISEEATTIAPVEVAPEVAAVVDEAPVATPEEVESYLIRLIHVTEDLIQDPNLDEVMLTEFAEFLDEALSSGTFDEAAQEILVACLEVCSGVYYERFAK